MSKISAVISGVGGYVPDYVLTNRELETMVETNDEWIVSRTGIRERRILKDPTLGSSFMAEKAARMVLEKTNTNPESIDLILCSTITPDYLCPVTSNILCEKLGAKNAFSYDLMAACSGFLYNLSTGTSFIESGRYKKALLVGVDKMSVIVNYKDRNTCIIFGDGAGAVLLEASENSEYGIKDMIMRTDGSGELLLNIKAGGSKYPSSKHTVENNEHYIYQEGATVFKIAVTKMAEVSTEIMNRNHLTKESVQWLVPHQANKRIIDATADRMGLPLDKVTINIDKFGNTTNGTIPLCLWDFEKKFKKGDNLILAAFGGGFTWGGMYLKWAYNS
ncbi:MAG: beta-ketoacyl-ACP synthase III [Cytophagales bacterium]|nr:beta-ketoacyl-ACP synthase III [Cytophagales bacterium]